MKLRTPSSRATYGRADTIVFAEPMNGKAIEVPASAHTYQGFREWTLSDDFPEQGRITYIAGRVYVDLTMEELEGHNKAKTVVSRELSLLTDREDLGEFYSDGTRVANPEADVSNEPDAVFCLWETLESGRAVLVPKTSDAEQYMLVEGTPDVVVKIVSDSSVTKDKGELRDSYHKAGIPEYWLIDARKRLEFQILLWSPAGYQPAPGQSGWQKSRVFGRQFRLSRRKARLGHWKYQLEARG